MQDLAGNGALPEGAAMARLGEGALGLVPIRTSDGGRSRSCPWEQPWVGDRDKGALPSPWGRALPPAPSAPQVRCWRHDEKEESARRIRTVGNQTSTRVSNLRGNALYHLAVRAYNTAGTGPSSAAVNVTTKKPRECWVDWVDTLEKSIHCSPLWFPTSPEAEGVVRLLLARFSCRFTKLGLFYLIFLFREVLFPVLSKQSMQNQNHSCAGKLNIYVGVQEGFFPLWSQAC